MNELLSEDTKTILLLCGHFSKSNVKPLALHEYNMLVQWLIGEDKRPSALLDSAILDIAANQTGIEHTRLEQLLARGVQLGFAVEEWQRNGLWVISRSDVDYPARYKKHLKDKAPPLLFGAGNRSLLSGGGLAIIGSRNVELSGATFAREVAALCAKTSLAVVSGGARGVDQLATTACLDHGGIAVSVLAEHLLKKSVERTARLAIADGRLLLISPYHPTAPFSVGSAMSRNKFIYGLADYGLVVSADFKKGGTWAGAEEELQRKSSIPVFVRTGDNIPKGNTELQKRGAIAWPHVVAPENLLNALSQAVVQRASTLSELPLMSKESKTIESNILPECALQQVHQLPIKDTEFQDRSIYDAVLPILLAHVQSPISADDLAEKLHIQKKQLTIWLKKAMDEDKIGKTLRPERYVKKQQIQQSLLN